MPVLSQTGLAKAWGPPCTGERLSIKLFGTGVVTVRASLGDAVLAFDACCRYYNYPTRRIDTGAYACRKKRGLSGWSNHAYATAMDINWLSNLYGRKLVTDMPPEFRAAFKAIRTKSGVQVWGWGGDWKGIKDAMHVEVICSPADIWSGIDPATVPGGMQWPPPPPVTGTPVEDAPPEQEEEDMVIYQQNYGKGFAALSNGGYLVYLDSEQLAFWEGRMNVPKEVVIAREWDLIRTVHINGQSVPR